ncbi:MarR family winged helix-turn-helix transcriptional regulator [Xanthobacter sp. KR7-225]|uniref:MarR family winged helix-turn-helix transcriptional regulator n=1 Tax=Xanthobacter sp. KR7-225 TaxID=3156613 RepID=UPI0032B421D3
MEQMPSETVVRAWTRLMRAQRLALASIEGALKAAGLPPLVWYDVLLEVERAGPDGLRPYELERAMLLAQYNLSRLIDRIEAAGYVERKLCADDGRGQRIVMTDAGKAIRRQMWPIYAREIERAIGGRLSAEQAEVLGDLLGRLVDGRTVPKAASKALSA